MLHEYIYFKLNMTDIAEYCGAILHRFDTVKVTTVPFWKKKWWMRHSYGGNFLNNFTSERSRLCNILLIIPTFLFEKINHYIVEKINIWQKRRKFVYIRKFQCEESRTNQYTVCSCSFNGILIKHNSNIRTTLKI